MTTSEAAKMKPLWLSMEESLLGLGSQDLAGESLEASIKKIAADLDNAGYNVSHHGGNLLALRWAIDDMRAVGRPLMKDINTAVAALTLADVAEPYAATHGLIQDIGKNWPKFKNPERRPEVIRMVEQARLDLLVAKAKSLEGDKGIRYLIDEKVTPEVITTALDITAEKLTQVNKEMEAERAERARVTKLLEAVADKSDPEKVKHLFDNNVTEALILEIAKVDQAAIDGAKKAMEAELAEKKRLEEEEGARKKAEAEGPSLDDIPADELLDYIESVREIMEFSEVEKEIRGMCEQSAIPKALVDIAVSDPDKLDELEKKAEG